MVVGKLPFGSPTDGKINYNLDFSDKKLSPDLTDLLSKILTTDMRARLSATDILKHPWFADTPTYLDIFDEQEKDLILSEFTVTTPVEQQQDCLINTNFTECSIESHLTTGNLLKNSSSRSVVFCPFNTPKKQEDVQTAVPFLCEQLLTREKVIKFGAKVREVNREYEKFNNLDFDNGVYHKFAYKNQPQIDRADQQNKKQKQQA